MLKCDNATIFIITYPNDSFIQNSFVHSLSIVALYHSSIVREDEKNNLPV